MANTGAGRHLAGPSPPTRDPAVLDFLRFMFRLIETTARVVFAILDAFRPR